MGIKSEEYIYLSGFSGTVLAQQGVNFTFSEMKGHIVNSSKTTETLGDVIHLNDVLTHN